MSAVSSESPRAAADLSAPTDSSSTPSVPPGRGSAQPASARTGRADFGPNEWLVDELYQRYLADPASVDRAWWSFFADYRPRGNGTGPLPVLTDGGRVETPPPPAAAPGGAAPANGTPT